MDDDSSLSVKRYKSKPNTNVHFCAHQLFDKIAQQDDEKDELLLADEMIEDCDADDETEAWISSNRDRSEEEVEYKPVVSVSVGTSSSSWNEDVYEKPSLVV